MSEEMQQKQGKDTRYFKRNGTLSASSAKVCFRFVETGTLLKLEHNIQC